MIDPSTPAEWQRAYGLVAGGPEIDVDRCDEILRRGAGLGFTPRPADEVAQELIKPA